MLFLLFLCFLVVLLYGSLQQIAILSTNSSSSIVALSNCMQLKNVTEKFLSSFLYKKKEKTLKKVVKQQKCSILQEF